MTPSAPSPVAPAVTPATPPPTPFPVAPAVTPATSAELPPEAPPPLDLASLAPPKVTKAPPVIPPPPGPFSPDPAEPSLPLPSPEQPLFSPGAQAINETELASADVPGSHAPPARVNSPELGVAPTTLSTPALSAPADRPGASPEIKDSQALAAQNALEPMPALALPGFFSGLPYFFKVTGARLKRGGVIRSFQREIKQEEDKREEIFRNIGQLGRKLQLNTPELADIMGVIRSLEQQREEVELGQSELTAQGNQEEQQFSQTEASLNAQIEEIQQEIVTAQDALKARNEEHQGVKGRLAEQDKKLKNLMGQRDSRRSKATKEKDPDQRRDLEQDAAELAVQIGDGEKEREQITAELTALEAPIAELNEQLKKAREKRMQLQKGVTEARQALANSKRQLQAEERKQGVEIARLEKEISARFLDLGRILAEHRADDPQLTPLYGEHDRVAEEIRKRQDCIATMELERETYDRGSMKNGKILAGSIAGLIGAMVLTLIIIFVL